MREATVDDGAREDLVIDLRSHERGDGPVIVRTGEAERRHRTARLVGVVVLVVLNVADLLTTDAFLEAGAAEGNPVGAFLIAKGWVGWVKAGLLLALGLRVLRTPPRLNTTCALWFVVGVYTTVIAMNLTALRHLGVL